MIETIRILQIEDNREEAQLIQAMLGNVRDFQYKITHVDLLAQGLEHLKKAYLGQEKIDVILLDLHLPDSSGYESFERVYQQACRVPVVLMTNLDNEELALRAVRQGAQDYLVKTELSGHLIVRSIRYAIERKRVEEALRESQERYRLATQGANDGLWDWDMEASQVYYSPRWKNILGFQEEEIDSQPEEWLGRIHPEDVQATRNVLLAHWEGASPHFENEHRIQCKDGSYKWVLVRGMAVRNGQGKAYRMAGSLSDIAQRKLSEEKLVHDAFHDALTGLPNRSLFVDRLKHAIERSKRYRDNQYAVLFLDLDRFKVINDSLGHSSGDKLLVMVAELLSSCLRAGDSVARLGGDEFVILLDPLVAGSDAVMIAERIQQMLQTPVELSSHKVVISASIGIVFSDRQYDFPEDVLRDADIAMYHAKMIGKACHVEFKPLMRKRAIARMELENDLRQVLFNEKRLLKELSVVFQPIVSMHNGRIVGFEALLRWMHPERGPISPNEFIPVAEETGLIHTLGLWVLRKACQQVRKWQNLTAGSDGAGPVTVNVNISGKQFSRPDLVNKIEEIIQENLLSPSSLSLEITESLLLGGEEPFHGALEKIRNLGVNLQVDDFGRGYSSFSYLQRLPVSSLKIDSLFIRRLTAGGSNSEIVRSIVGLARSLGMSVIAEGVETDVQMQKLRELECPYVQGYYISKPLTGEEAGTLLSKNWEMCLSN